MIECPPRIGSSRSDIHGEPLVQPPSDRLISNLDDIKLPDSVIPEVWYVDLTSERVFHDLMRVRRELVDRIAQGRDDLRGRKRVEVGRGWYEVDGEEALRVEWDEESGAATVVDDSKTGAVGDDRAVIPAWPGSVSGTGADVGHGSDEVDDRPRGS